ncbi:MAG TPA: arginase family protein [Thermoanaerobaculia bacterium]|nr:arginase family protein [Thermoanaerobaculia bacterium]
MRISLIEVPYDCGRFGERMGSGPLELSATLPPALASAGHDVEVRRVRLPDRFFHEVAAVVALQHEVRREVAAAREAGRLPVVLSGNCGYAALGAAAALPPRVGVLWLDAHADFNTPESSPSGFFDGTCLATLAGRAWAGVSRRFDGFTPVAEERVVLLGARALDDVEREGLSNSDVAWLAPPDLRADPAALPVALDALARRADRLYLHLDLDVIDPAELRANLYACDGGLTVDEVTAAIAAAGERIEIAAVSLTAYDASADDERRGPAVAARLLAAVAAAVDARA